MNCLRFTIFLLLISKILHAQQNFAFTHITIDDGMGLASNLVTSLHQDEKGFIWVGTANGLQRFDGSKFLDISAKTDNEKLLHARISQIIPTNDGKLVLAIFSLREFAVFDPATFIYKRIVVKPSANISPQAEYRVWKDSRGEIYLNIGKYGTLHYNKTENSFVDDHPFVFPKGWSINTHAVYDNTAKQQIWFGCDSGLCIYDRSTRQMWSKRYNPRNLPILNNKKIQDNITEVYIDKKKRIWLFGWPSWSPLKQIKYCFDSSGSSFLQQDTLGLNHGAGGIDYKYFYETRQGEIWMYGFNVLMNYDRNAGRFHFNKSSVQLENFDINYESIFQILEDRESNIWIATNQGIYYTAISSSNNAVTNLTFNSKNGPTSINDIVELPNGEIWFTSWRAGVTSTDRFLNKIPNRVYSQPPPANWPPQLKEAILQTVSIFRDSFGNVLIGCNNGVLIKHNPERKTTEYLHPPETNNSNINYITQDSKGQIWICTQGGRLIKWSNNTFTVIDEIGTIITKAFFDRDGWLWIATREKGLYAINPDNGKILQNYSANGGKNSLYGNTITDIEQMKSGEIAFGAGALHFVNKVKGTVSILQYEDGLPSNTVSRIRMDSKGYLWIITSNGLCRYNPNNNHITPYGRKDGVVLAEQTIAADFMTSNGHIIFGGSNSVIMFNPAAFYTSQQPPDVTITDIKIFNHYLPIDSLTGNSNTRLNHDENSLSIYFASLSYRQRDKLTYYYKMQGLDKDWIKADRSYLVNYSLLPPGSYTFKIYCENIDGIRSKNITELKFTIKPPFFKTWWFISCLLFLVAILIYVVHQLRVNKLLAVETLRNRVARDLHDDMGSTLSTINILSSMAITKVEVDRHKTSEYLTKIGEYSQRMMDVMDDIVWSIKPSNDSMQKITARMREFATNVLEAKEIDFDFKTDEELFGVKLDMEARRDFFLVFKEAVNNAAKYSKARKVLMEVTMINKRVILIVQDDGVGFDMAEADGNGLGNMQKRADNLNGNVTIKTKKGEGTTVKLVVPVI